MIGDSGSASSLSSKRKGQKNADEAEPESPIMMRAPPVRIFAVMAMVTLSVGMRVFGVVHGHEVSPRNKRDGKATEFCLSLSEGTKKATPSQKKRAFHSAPRISVRSTRMPIGCFLCCAMKNSSCGSNVLSSSSNSFPTTSKAERDSPCFLQSFNHRHTSLVRLKAVRILPRHRDLRQTSRSCSPEKNPQFSVKWRLDTVQLLVVNSPRGRGK